MAAPTVENLNLSLSAATCPSCGNKYAMERTTCMSFKLVNVQHRHCIFSIDENLRHFFLEDRSLLDCLFHAVNNVVMFFKQNKSMNFTPGFIMDNPPEGMTSEDIRRMSEDDLLDMDYFLHENDVFADETGIEGFYLF